jgi:hypothetical protein
MQEVWITRLQGHLGIVSKWLSKETTQRAAQMVQRIRRSRVVSTPLFLLVLLTQHRYPSPSPAYHALPTLEKHDSQLLDPFE